MKNYLKVTLIVVGILVGIIAIDTLQAKIFDNSPLLKIRENNIDKGLLVNHYDCYDEDVTLFKNVKYSCKIEEEPNKSKYSKTIDNVTIELNMLDWHFEEQTFEDSKFALKIYKDSKENYATLNFYNNPFGVCGTGRTTEEITLNNGSIGTIGFYGDPIWSDISFYDLNPNIAFINNGLSEKETEEFLEIVKTLNIIK